MQIDEYRKLTLEIDFQKTIIELAEIYGWCYFHDNDSRRNIAGLPDLILVRERVIYAELKKQDGKLSRKQKEWIARLKNARQEVYVWRPSDFEDIVKILKRNEN